MSVGLNCFVGWVTSFTNGEQVDETEAKSRILVFNTFKFSILILMTILDM